MKDFLNLENLEVFPVFQTFKRRPVPVAAEAPVYLEPQPYYEPVAYEYPPVVAPLFRSELKTTASF